MHTVPTVYSDRIEREKRKLKVLHKRDNPIYTSQWIKYSGHKHVTELKKKEKKDCRFH